MGELWFVGLGLGDERGLSERAFEALRRAERVFVEEYTSVPPPGTWDRLAERLGHPVERLNRAEVESERPVLAALGAGARVAFVTAGDPFSATTHVALRVAAEAAGHTWRYVPGASILSAAAGLLGLMPYRFGRPVSLPLPEPSFAPTSPLELIAANRERGLHTLVLLDLRPEEGRVLTADAALRLLRERDPTGRWVPAGVLIGVAARVGREDAGAWVGPIESLAQRSFGPPPHALVVMADLHFEEAAAVAGFRRAAD